MQNNFHTNHCQSQEHSPDAVLWEERKKKIYAICLAMLESIFNVLDSGAMIDDFLTVILNSIWIFPGNR